MNQMDLNLYVTALPCLESTNALSSHGHNLPLGCHLAAAKKCLHSIDPSHDAVLYWSDFSHMQLLWMSLHPTVTPLIILSDCQMLQLFQKPIDPMGTTEHETTLWWLDVHILWLIWWILSLMHYLKISKVATACKCKRCIFISLQMQKMYFHPIGAPSCTAT